VKETISLALGFTLWGEEKGANYVPNGHRLKKKRSTKDKRLPSWLVVNNSKISTQK